MTILKNLSESSQKAYNGVINKFKTIFNAENNDFLLDSKKVIEHIKNMDVKLHTKKSYYIALYSVLARDTTGKFNGVLEDYKSTMDEYNKKQTEVYETQQLSESDAEKMLKWADILKVRTQLKKSANIDFQQYQNYLIVSLYTMNAPVRLDYADMLVVDKVVEGKQNLLIWNEKECYFLFRSFKNARTHGEVRVEVSKPLKKVLEGLKTYRTVMNEHLLLNRNNEPMTSSVLGQTIIRIFKAACGKAVGVDILRKSFVSNYRKGEKSIKEQKKIANAMMHSIGISQTVYRKINLKEN